MSAVATRRYLPRMGSSEGFEYLDQAIQMLRAYRTEPEVRFEDTHAIQAGNCRRTRGPTTTGTRSPA